MPRMSLWRQNETQIYSPGYQMGSDLPSSKLKRHIYNRNILQNEMEGSYGDKENELWEQLCIWDRKLSLALHGKCIDKGRLIGHT